MLRDSSTEYQTLEFSPVGTKRVLLEVAGDEAIVARLCELGFVKGASVELIALGPFGSPFVIRIHRTTVALRQSEVQCLKV